ncbi:hypothetical protein BDR05DRAFT_947892 [Suillus weaverae]|nr:hypothetical protein BDR05DRAFT_947892 [Suillus weaverae]
MSSSVGAIRQLAIQLCEIINKARATSANVDTLTSAKQAGQIVTRSMKLAPDVMAIPPILLSCAMALSTCAKYVNGSSVEIVHVPDWGAIGSDDHRIMQHPQYMKAIVWMTSMGAAKEVDAVKVFGDGINWQMILHRGVDQRKVLGQHKGGVGASTSHQPLNEGEVGLVGTSQMPKPRTFGPAKKTAEDRKRKGVDQEKGDVESLKGKGQEVVTANTQQHWSDKRGRKRRRTSQSFAEDAESSDDLPMEGPSNKVIDMDNISGSNKTGNRLNSCQECTRKKQKCFYGRKPETVARGRSRATSRAKSRARSKTRARSPATSSPTSRSRSRAAFPSLSRSRRSITMGSPHVAAPDTKLSSIPPIPVPVDAAINSMEDRLIAIEAGLAKLHTAIEQLGEEHEALRQKVVPQHPTFPLPHAPSLSSAQPLMFQPSSGEPRSIPPVTLPPATLPPATLPPATLPPATLPPEALPPVKLLSETLPSTYPHSSASMATPVQTDVEQLWGAGDDVMDFGVGPVFPEPDSYGHQRRLDQKFSSAGANPPVAGRASPRISRVMHINCAMAVPIPLIEQNGKEQNNVGRQSQLKCRRIIVQNTFVMVYLYLVNSSLLHFPPLNESSSIGIVIWIHIRHKCNKGLSTDLREWMLLGSGMKLLEPPPHLC